VDWTTATVILQLFDNSIYHIWLVDPVERKLPKDRLGTYHIESSLAVADKAAIKDLVAHLAPLFKELGDCLKIVLTALARYWVAPCCSDSKHHINYGSPSYHTRLGDAVHALCDNIRDSLYTRRVPNSRVFCPYRMVGVGQQNQVPTDKEAAKAAALWGRNLVHPTAVAYRCMAEQLECDLNTSEARYTNPAKPVVGPKRPKLDLSTELASWITGSSAAAQKRDLSDRQPTRGQGVGRRPFPDKWPASGPLTGALPIAEENPHEAVCLAILPIAEAVSSEGDGGMGGQLLNAGPAENPQSQWEMPGEVRPINDAYLISLP
jgi:hypothetical protein